jgi:gamma-glutamylcyclotransferase (GGCT)/AIG2-like uncharacterized protein YtfP
MRLFLYGTLRDSTRLAQNSGDPPLPPRRESGGKVLGALPNVGAPVAQRLAAYEGAPYRLARVVVNTPFGKTAARA